MALSIEMRVLAVVVMLGGLSAVAEARQLTRRQEQYQQEVGAAPKPHPEPSSAMILGAAAVCRVLRRSRRRERR
jgi:hypothetical protein